MGESPAILRGEVEVRIIPVIDLRDGRAVRGAAGERERYRPVRSRLAKIPGGDLSDPSHLLSAYRSALGSDTVYVADLDRIMGRGRNDPVLKRLLDTAQDIRLLLDGGFSDAASLQHVSRGGRIVPVVGTETLGSPDDLRSLQMRRSWSPPILSLDLRLDEVASRSAALGSMSAEEVLGLAQRCGFRTVIVLFLDRIGTARGLPHDRLRRLRETAPDLDLLAGGGIASIEELDLLHRAGFSGALLATALHDGLLSPETLRLRGYLP